MGAGSTGSTDGDGDVDKGMMTAIMRSPTFQNAG